MSEVRTTSSTGGQKGVKAERYDLLPKAGLDAMARVYAFGALKYADHNWRLKYEWSKSIASALRHTFAVQDGQTYDVCPGDPEDCAKWSEEHQRCLEHSGEPHAAMAMFHLAALLTWLEEDGEGADNPFDDRWPAAMERARRAREAAEVEEGWIPEPVWTAAVADEQQEWAGWEEIGYITDDGLAEAAGFKRPNAQQIGVEWQDPEPLRLADLKPYQDAINEMIAKILRPVPVRFVCGIRGIEDLENPLTEAQDAAAEAGMVRIGEYDGKELWANRTVLEPCEVKPIFTLPEGYRPAEKDDFMTRVYLHHWYNRR